MASQQEVTTQKKRKRQTHGGDEWSQPQPLGHTKTPSISAMMGGMVIASGSQDQLSSEREKKKGKRKLKRSDTLMSVDEIPAVTTAHVATDDEDAGRQKRRKEARPSPPPPAKQPTPPPEAVVENGQGKKSKKKSKKAPSPSPDGPSIIPEETFLTPMQRAMKEKLQGSAFRFRLYIRNFQKKILTADSAGSITK